MNWKSEIFSRLSLIEESLNDVKADIAFIKNSLSSISKLMEEGLKNSDNALLLNAIKLELSEMKILLNRIINLQLSCEKKEVEMVLP